MDMSRFIQDLRQPLTQWWGQSLTQPQRQGQNSSQRRGQNYRSQRRPGQWPANRAQYRQAPTQNQGQSLVTQDTSQGYTPVAQDSQGYTPVTQDTSQGYTPVAQDSQGYTPVNQDSQGYTPVNQDSQGYTPVTQDSQGYTFTPVIRDTSQGYSPVQTLQTQTQMPQNQIIGQVATQIPEQTPTRRDQGTQTQVQGKSAEIQRGPRQKQIQSPRIQLGPKQMQGQSSQIQRQPGKMLGQSSQIQPQPGKMQGQSSQTQQQQPRQQRSGQGPRAQAQRRKPRMNDVNMPSGTKVSIVIPSRSTCACTVVGENLNLITLKPDGKMSGREYKIVADEMHKTLQAHNYTSYSIKQIQKVQNCCLWSKFRAIEKQIAQDARYVNERMLFHGSAAADAIVKTGFDLTKAKGGLFGNGVYFAKNSSKSNQYSPGYLGHRRMLLCRVALGRMHKTTTTGVTAVPLGHHSVEGNLAVPEYVVYNADQAYPEYLVYYDISN